MNVAIIGAGWYGCHIAMSLIQSGCDVTVFEKSDSTISGASKRNQNRLHLGFHYPRDSVTRAQSKEGFDWFIEHYPHLVSEVENNFYAVSDKNSYIDSETYKIIMEGSGLNFQTLDKNSVKEIKIKNVGELFKCEEKVIRNDLASKYFNDMLSKHIKFNTFVDLNNELVFEALKEKYDYIIDCTWGRAKKISTINYFFEPCIYFYYKSKINDMLALTIMDGQHYSLYPYFDDIYTLTSVQHTPIGQYQDVNEALMSLSAAKQDNVFVKQKRAVFETEFSNIVEDFLENFEYFDVEFSMKTKVVSSTDFRGCIVEQDKQLISVFSGKIDTLQIAERAIHSIINTSTFR
ncbi:MULTISPECIES: FAD-dependent oxidoreductase [Vibrio]|uniref:FAD-dependent oxidoreductase n=1 Tax=Vibrio TaxID=662 RepID=UPI00107FAF5C|nr:FAD-dependent oxidoreductase [Vibrio tasmaniensis]